MLPTVEQRLEDEQIPVSELGSYTLKRNSTTSPSAIT
jgi:hypothetical protein